MVKIAVEFGVIDAEVAQQLLGLPRIACFGRIDGFAAAVAQDEFAVGAEFVADGVARRNLGARPAAEFWLWGAIFGRDRRRSNRLILRR